MADLPLGFVWISLAWGVRTFFCNKIHLELDFPWGDSCASSFLEQFFKPCLIFCLELRLYFSVMSIPWRKRLIIRSSSEWKERATRRPPGFRNFSAVFSPIKSSWSSLFTNIRRPWKVLVATCAGLWSKSFRAYSADAGKAPVKFEKGDVNILLFLHCYPDSNPLKHDDFKGKHTYNWTLSGESPSL